MALGITGASAAKVAPVAVLAGGFLMAGIMGGSAIAYVRKD